MHIPELPNTLVSDLEKCRNLEILKNWVKKLLAKNWLKIFPFSQKFQKIKSELRIFFFFFTRRRKIDWKMTSAVQIGNVFVYGSLMAEEVLKKLLIFWAFKIMKINYYIFKSTNFSFSISWYYNYSMNHKQ